MAGPIKGYPSNNSGPDEYSEVTTTQTDVNTLKKTALDVSIRDVAGFAGQIDAFGRLRISAPIELLGNKNIYSGNEHIWHKKEVGTGVVSYLSNESAMSIAVGTADADRAVRQTRPNLYIPGKSQLINLTGLFGATPTVNNVRRVGLFDDGNGVFLEINGNDVYFVVRSDVSGSIVEDKIEQANWNIDTYPDLDLTKVQILSINFQWLGVGRVDFLFANPDGTYRLCHRFEHANTTTTVYMREPTLPVRYENLNIGTTANGTVLKEICSNVSSEGGEVRTGFNFTAGGGSRTIVAGPPQPVFAIRLKNTFNGRENRVLFQSNGGQLFSREANVLFQLHRVSEPASITGTWVDVDQRSASEYSSDITAYTGSEETVVTSSFITASSLGSNVTSSASPVSPGEINEHSFISQNVDSTSSDMFVITALSTDGGTTDVAVGVNFIEFH